MATLTRSRRAEGLHPNTVNANARLIATSTRSAGQTICHNVTSGRTKRLEIADCEYDTVRAKKQKLTVEIRSATIPQHPKPAVNVALQQAAAPAAPTPKPKPASARTQSSTTVAVQLAERGESKAKRVLTKHQKKLVNGIRHELDRLQPTVETAKKPEGRKLRSQEGTRFKSELSAYFPEYDEVIGNEPKEHRTFI